MNKRDNIQEEALTEALKHKRCSLGISMGVGKTLIGLKYINHLQSANMFKLNVLVVAPKLTIFESWKNDAEKFNINIDNISFTTYLSLNKQALDYDLLVLDECHSLLYTHKDFLNNYKGRILGLTGTPPKWSHSEKGEMVNKFCPVVYTYVTDNAVDDKILNDYKIIIHNLPLDKNKNILVEYQNKSWYTSEFAEYTYYTNKLKEATTPKNKKFLSIARMRKMMNFKSKEVYAKNLFNSITDKCILFANTQEQADSLCEYSYHSKNMDSENILKLFNEGSINKMSAVLQLNEGVNIKNLKSGIIMHAYGNERKSSQRIGRLLRLNPNDTSLIHILCYSNTIDETWVKNALENFDENKIIYT